MNLDQDEGVEAEPVSLKSEALYSAEMFAGVLVLFAAGIVWLARRVTGHKGGGAPPQIATSP